MTLLTTSNGVKALLFVVCLLLLFNVIINYFGYRTEKVFTVSKLRFRKIHNYTKIINHSIVPLTVAQKQFAKNLTLIPANTSIDQTSEHFEMKSVKIKFKNMSNYGIEVPLNNSQSIRLSSNNISLSECESRILEEGRPIKPNTTLESLDVVEAKLGPLLDPGGSFHPKNCTPIHHVAIVVPFRDRYAHLSVFLRNIHPFLMKQQIAYRIFIVEQTNGKPFNRAALMNIGFLEALKIFPWDCFIFHDVDLLPLDERNVYSCPRQPRHMSVAIDTLNYKLPYRSIFGGVSAMTTKQFQKVNGFSNSYFGWGGEDDDMSNRLKHANLFISRYPVNIARYMMLKHRKEKANPKRYETLVNGISKFEMDGLNSIKYDVYSIKYFPAFTWYLAELKISDQKS